MAEPWTKRVELASVNGEQYYAQLRVEDGKGAIELGSDTPDSLNGRSIWLSSPAAITTKNMAQDLAHELEQMAEHLDA